MLHSKKLSAASLYSLMLFQPYTASADVIEEALTEGKPTINVRYRYEGVDDSVNKDAKASTLRTRLGYTTSDKFDLTVHMDFEHVTRVGPPDYNSTQNGQTDYAVVADPSVAELNQAYLRYEGLEGSDFKLGRQRIILDNARFVGNVGWRQNEQTFDAFRYDGKFSNDLFFTYSNLQKVLTITGGGVYSNHNLVNLGMDNLAGGKLTAYGYLLDFDETSNNDTATYGLRYKGAADNFLYTLEYAQQSDYAENTNDFAADYLFGEFGYKFGDNFKAFIAYESLGSDNGIAFQTPLATKHAFNGWADKFLVTPPEGLNDAYVKAVGKVAGLKLIGVYHDFSADVGGADYGSEIDLLVAKKFNDTFTGLIKYADYSADSFSKDTSKVWLQVVMKI